MRAESLRVFLVMDVREDLECRQCDIKNTFTESHLKERIFLASPEGLKVEKGHVLRALGSLCRLKQAGRYWNLFLRKFLIELGLVQNKAEPCMFVNKIRDLQILVYVDDILRQVKQKKKLWLVLR